MSHQQKRESGHCHIAQAWGHMIIKRLQSIAMMDDAQRIMIHHDNDSEDGSDVKSYGAPVVGLLRLTEPTSRILAA